MINVSLKHITPPISTITLKYWYTIRIHIIVGRS
jgi:hypothetical protein